MLEHKPVKLTRREALAGSLGAAATVVAGAAASNRPESAAATDKATRERWLVVSAHPDDESKCAALLLKERKPGDELILLEMRLCGEGRLYDRPKRSQEEAIAVRATEMEKATAHLKADELKWWTPPHPENVNIAKTPETVDKMAGLLETIQPTRLITHWPEDWHPDHIGTAELVDESVERLGKSGRLKTVYYFSTPGREKDQPNFDPEHFVDISDPSELSFVLWARAIHRSQMSYNTQTSYLRQYKKFGREAGTEFADGYVVREV